jgi:hypothetical protein
LFSTLPQGVNSFKDKDRPFFQWLAKNSADGYFLNVLSRTKLMLHRARCRHIGQELGHTYTKHRQKVCSLSRPDLERAAKQEGIEPTLCRTCLPKTVV